MFWAGFTHNRRTEFVPVDGTLGLDVVELPAQLNCWLN